MNIPQSGIQKRGLLFEGPRPQGLQLRGVVMATYVLDDPQHPSQTKQSDNCQDPVSVYCDVLIYSNLRAMHSHGLSMVPVLQSRGGIHSGHIWKPRATTIDVTNNPVDPNSGTLLGNMDGDHVLIGFIDDALNQPIILGGVPHPSQDTGNEKKGIGNRLGLKLVDGSPDYWKHNGAFFGISEGGNWALDTTFANNGKLDTNGNEAAPPVDGSGSQYFRLPKDAEWAVKLYNMVDPLNPALESFISFINSLCQIALNGGTNTLSLADKDADAELMLGNGAKHVPIVEALQIWLITHTHPTGVGPSGPPTQAWDTNINSTHVSIPDK